MDKVEKKSDCFYSFDELFDNAYLQNKIGPLTGTWGDSPMVEVSIKRESQYNPPEKRPLMYILCRSYYDINFSIWLQENKELEYGNEEKYKTFLTKNIFGQFLKHHREQEKKWVDSVIEANRKEKEDWGIEDWNMEDSRTKNSESPTTESNTVKTFGDYLTCKEEIDSVIARIKKISTSIPDGRAWAVLILALVEARRLILPNKGRNRIYDAMRKEFNFDVSNNTLKLNIGCYLNDKAPDSGSIITKNEICNMINIMNSKE